MTATFNLLVGSMQQLVYQMAAFFPKIIVAILIWLIGKRLINIGVALLKKISIKGTKLDDYLVSFLTKIAVPLGKFILVLIILDYLGVGRTIIGAFMNGLTLAVAIALGLAFGRALEEDARQVLSEIRKHIKA